MNGILTKEYLVSQGVDENRIYEGGMCADSAGLARLSASMTEEEKSKFTRSNNLYKQKGIRYIYVGQIIERKGLSYLLKAWVSHQHNKTEDELLIVGEGPLLKEYRKQYGNIPSIKFIGGVDYSQIYKFYSISDVFIIPTLEDNWSLVVPEAMACGLPIACSIYNGCHPELVHTDVNGVTFNPLISQSITKALDYFQNRDLKKMGNASIEIEKEFSPSNVADIIIQSIDIP